MPGTIQPKRGETKEAFIERFTSSQAPQAAENPSMILNKAVEAWEVATSSHAGETSTCCKGKTFEHFSFNLASYKTSIRKFEGRDHLVAPVVMLVEGVHTGSLGPIYYPSEEIAKFPGAWNGIPIPIYHPEQDGFPVSANSPEILESRNAGRVFGARSVEGGKKLKAELWFDVAKLQAIDPSLLTRINSGETVEVSTGLFLEEEEKEGVWNGETYMAIARNFRPDHLAVLPGATGACSAADGCGIRANAAVFDYEKAWKRVVSNLLSFQDISSAIRQQLLSSMEKPYSDTKTGVSFWLQETYKDYFIYERELQEGKIQYFKQGYSFDSKTGTVSLVGDAVEVRRQTIYKEIKTNQGGRKVNKEQMVEFLLANGCTGTKETLSETSEDVLQFMVNKVKEVGEVKDQITAINVEVETLKANVQKKPNTVEEYLASAPAEIQMTLNRAMARERQVKDELVLMLVKNQKAFNEDELKTKSVDELEKLASLAAPKDFSLRGAQVPERNADIGDEEPLASPTFNFQK